MMTSRMLKPTALAIGVGHWWSWSHFGYGPYSALIVLGVLFTFLRTTRQRHEGDSRSYTVTPETIWTTVAFCSLVIGGFAGMLAFNPDGYMQPKPNGAPWWLIIPGSVIGAAAGALIGWLLSQLNYREPAQDVR